MSYHSWPAEGGGSGGSAFWGDSVPNLASLPASGAVVGELRQTLDTKSIWRWTGVLWEIYLDYPGEILKLQGIGLNIQDQLDAITTDIVALDTDLDTAEGDIDALEAQDVVLDGLINALDGRLDTIEGQTLDTRLTGAESDIDILQAHDTAVTIRVDDLEADRVLKAGDTMTGALILHADPSTGLQAATKQYADNLSNGQKWKLNVRLATTANIASLTGTPTIDGVLAAVDDRILVKDQSTAADNGIYICAAGAWARALDADVFSELNSASVMASEGTQNGDKGFYQTAELTSFASAQVWIQNFGSGLYAADEATLHLTGKTFSIADGGVDLTSLKVVGANPISKGGTGQVTATAAFAALADSVLTTKGDLLAFGTTAARFPAGADGLSVMADSSAAQGLRWGSAGSGFGEKNYIANHSALIALSHWASVGDLDVVRTTTAAELPREFTTGSGLKITADSNTQSVADYVYFDFSLDDVDLNKKLKIQWSQKLFGAYAAGQLAVVITSQADRTTALYTPQVTAIPAADDVFETYFTSASLATLSLVIRATTDMVVDTGIVISDVVVGPGIGATGAVIQNDYAYNTNVTATASDTSSFGTGPGGVPFNASWVTGTAYVRRVQFPDAIQTDDTFEVQILTNGQWVSLPDRLGAGYAQGSTPYGPAIVGVSGNTSALDITFGSGGFGLPGSFGGNGAAWGTRTESWRVRRHRTVSNVNIGAGAQVEYAYNSSLTTANDTTSFATGPQGIALQAFAPSGTTPVSKRVQFNTPIQDGDQFVLEVNDAVTGWQAFSQRLGGFSANDAGTTLYGYTVAQFNATQVDVRFYSQAISGTAWSTLSAFKWRVRKFNPSSSVGFGQATATESGLVSKETSGSFTAAVTGPYSTSITVNYSRVGKTVTLSLPSVTGTSTTGAGISIAVTNMPSFLAPAVQQCSYMRITNNGTVQAGLIIVNTAPTLTVYADAAGSNFAATGTAGFSANSVTYVAAT